LAWFVLGDEKKFQFFKTLKFRTSENKIAHRPSLKNMSLTEAMSFLDDNRQRINEEVYLEMGRRLADAQDEMPTVYRVVYFTLDVEEGHVVTQRRETLAVAVTRGQRSAGGRSFGVRELLERGQCRVSWLASPRSSGTHTTS